ncbi:hypothetical protein [Candidatus Nitrospira bockiana]
MSGGGVRPHPFPKHGRIGRSQLQDLTRRIVSAFGVCAIILGMFEGPIRPVKAEIHGPPDLRSPPAAARFSPTNWQAAAPKPRPGLSDEEEGPTIERVSGEDKGPRVPEPMVFDLVRPLGARRGEAEANTLGIVPLARTAGTVDEAPDPLGLVRPSPDVQGFEWAPEVEFVVRDGVAVELELPLENARLEAYKAAGQLTFGTAFEDRMIHGLQTIVQYDIGPKVWTTSLLYLLAVRMDPVWSVMAMVGGRREIGGDVGAQRTEALTNVTLFADVSDRMVLGVETNVGRVINGSSAVLVMPQIHYEVDPHWMIQAGIGVRVTRDFTLPEIGFRLIREF